MNPGLPTGIVMTVGLLAAPALLRAQQPGQGQQPPQADTAALVFEREVFAYPEYERRNPFLPLVAANEAGPRFEELDLLGILYSPDPELSVALLSGGAQMGGPDGGGLQTYRVRQGQSLGNVRILEIQRARVIVEVTEFGLTERRVLELPRPGEGDSP